MTDDLVERLRIWTMDTENVGLRLRAADRIEQLEAALREVVKVDCGFVCQCAEISRTALGEKKDD